MQLSTLLSAFQQAILENDPNKIIPYLKSNATTSFDNQLKTYISGYRERLLHTIKNAYPATISIIGQEDFFKIAKEYIESTPPSNFNLDKYPHNFADFIKLKITNLPIIELATLESEISRIFFLPNSNALTASHMSKMNLEEFSTTMLKQRTASKLLKFKYDVNSYIDSFRQNKSLSFPTSHNIYIYICRNNHNIKRNLLCKSEYILLKNILSGCSIGNSVSKTLEEYPEFSEEISDNLQKWFTKWTENGFFTAPIHPLLNASEN